MKVTKSYIKQLVKEELNRVLKENYGIQDSDGVLEKFDIRIREAVQDAFMARGFKGGSLKAIKSGPNDSVIIIDWGVSYSPEDPAEDRIINVPLVWLNQTKGEFYVDSQPAKTPHNDINKKIDALKSKIKGAVDTANMIAKRNSNKQ